ncbi:Na(+)-translocating NADH-quinone reductase subunit A [Lentisphaera araneosa HTCC2155]|jgi:Na+-transporting NADH:ubiquinone oxidoreductase subunit A|uniref:Na(+)-translocating NADH-quinone reductase subunit A n=1 Tax=Lentisphaera araneosa HTCC2155 TaxID=313628 RepID=A6DRQ0_9BACT|nr:Na(+)-translocating NADH-quinone reductase subunit A [Lentisphaera araneosa]EDM25719.1 Na(+)-translocating NADH-quinone reductase subunit A [Lentisphaera araneosa HTCC2155]
MSSYKLKKGYDLRIKGDAEATLETLPRPTQVALDGREFHGLRPKMMVKAGDKVKAGSPLFLQKGTENFYFTSPVSGTVKDVKRGERRVLQEVIVDADETDEFEEFQAISAGDLLNTSREVILEQILKSGLFGQVLARPFAVLADPAVEPRDIFVSAYLTGPLAPEINLILEGNEAAFQAGINALSKLTTGSVNLGIEGGRSDLSEALKNPANAKVHHFNGPHPAGNVGIQIHHIAPINKDEVVWTLTAQAVISIGNLFIQGKVVSEKVIALTGESIDKRKHVKVITGASVADVTKGRVKSDENLRYISGDVLSGRTITGGFIGSSTSQLTVIPEINKMEFMGWVLPGNEKESFSRTFFSFLSPNKKYSHNTGYHGGERAFVQTGAYESVVPMDLYPVHLIKCIMAGDLEAMEGLGILEVAPEDLALCDFVCVSKIEVQDTLRKGLDFFRKEGC